MHVLERKKKAMGIKQSLTSVHCEVGKHEIKVYFWGLEHRASNPVSVKKFKRYRNLSN
jgi:hypothetical protein